MRDFLLEALKRRVAQRRLEVGDSAPRADEDVAGEPDLPDAIRVGVESHRRAQQPAGKLLHRFEHAACSCAGRRHETDPVRGVDFRSAVLVARMLRERQIALD